MRLYRLTAWSVPAGAILALLSGMTLGRAGAQATNSAAGVKDPVTGKIHTRNAKFDLPVNIDERARGTLREVILWVKPARGQWMKAKTVAPTEKRFHYEVPQDGEYWFNVMTVDQSGKTEPRDVASVPPGLMVVVDRQPPTFELQPTTLPSGQPGLRCIVHDANPRYQTVNITHQTPEGAVRPLEPAAGQPGCFRLPGAYVLNGSVHVTAADWAGNQVTRDVNLKELTTHGGQITPGQLAGQAQPIQQASATTPGLPVPPGNAPGGQSATPPTPPQSTHTVARQAPPAGLNVPSPGALPFPGSGPTAEVQSRKPAVEARQGMPARQVINTKHASITYRVDPVGPSGIGKVELWMTADRGASWQRVGEDLDRRSPAELDLPGEGLFGVRLVVSNGNGFGGQPPVANDNPHTWIEVDTTPPTAQLRDVEPAAKDGKLEIRWTVTDKNLSAEPINLYYATKREGPWQPIARGVKNDGLHPWAFPHDAGNQFYVRLEVADQAGNRTEVTTPMPVVLDMTEPHALVVGVTGVNAAPTQGH